MKNNIEHIVYLMLENRSFDSIMGWLYENDKPANFIPKTNTDPFNGLKNNGPYFNPDGKGGVVFANKIKPSQGQQVPQVDPHEKFQHVQTQIATTHCVDMGGFYLDFATKSKNPEEIMQSFSPDTLPVLNSLAKNFAVSDAYFSSIPTQTNCNRAFAATGNSLGHYYYNFERKLEAWVNNSFGVAEKWALDVTFNQRTIWDVLNDDRDQNGKVKHDWKIFYNNKWPISNSIFNYCFTQDLFWPTLGHQTPDHFADIEEFKKQAKDGTLPAFSFLEPAWWLEYEGIGYNGNDYHPPANVGCGEVFLNEIYTALKSNPEKWAKTLFIINFDEHGGTYDHVIPPSNDIPAPWHVASDGTPTPKKKELDFNFERLGVRVPLVLISPLIEDKTIIRPKPGEYFDHTSVLATILKILGVEKDKWKLGTRTANAGTFEDVITLSPDKARLDVKIDPPIPTTCKSNKPTPPNELQEMIMHRCFLRAIDQMNYSKNKFNDLYEEHFKNAETIEEMNEATRKIITQMSIETSH